jgi:uncharacterized membrane protein
MKKTMKISVILSILLVFGLSTYGIYDPNQDYTSEDPNEYHILGTEDGSTNVEDTSGQENLEIVEYKAKVIQNISVYTSELDGSKYQKVKVRIIDDGEYKDKEYEADYILQILDSSEAKQLDVGTTVYVMFNNGMVDSPTLIVKDIYRIPYLVTILIIFIATIILIGKKQGLKTVISLGITFYSIFYILVPFILNGHNAILMSVLICLLISVVTLTLVSGFNRKSLVSILGTISGVIISAILALIISSLARITGLSNEDAQMLIYVANGTSIDIYGLFFAGIIIGTVGATMDIAMSISSTMSELVKASKNISARDLIKSGLNVGKDSMGTMSNTLILAYVGESLILIILLMLNNSNFVSIINSDFIASEVLRGLCGTIGMISAIPITTYIFGAIYHFTGNEINGIK